jgi:type I restriction enzyme R subunit
MDDEIAAVLRAENLPADQHWRSRLRERDLASRTRIQRRLFAVRDNYLDAGYGRCLLGNPQYSAMVLTSLQHFDEDRYFLTDAVVMPNHVHFLAAFPSAEAMLGQCTG